MMEAHDCPVCGRPLLAEGFCIHDDETARTLKRLAWELLRKAEEDAREESHDLR